VGPMEGLMELIETLILGMLWSALDHAQNVVIEHQGPPMRFLGRDPHGVVHQLIALDGHTIRIPREFRVLMQPLEAVRIATPEVEAARWSTT
jgi:hypothetical protein